MFSKLDKFWQANEGRLDDMVIAMTMISYQMISRHREVSAEEAFEVLEKYMAIAKNKSREVAAIKELKGEDQDWPKTSAREQWRSTLKAATDQMLKDRKP